MVFFHQPFDLSLIILEHYIELSNLYMNLIRLGFAQLNLLPIAFG